MKLNNKGFIATATLYSTFIFMIVLILLILKLYNAEAENKIFGSEAVKDHINHIVPYDVKLK